MGPRREAIEGGEVGIGRMPDHAMSPGLRVLVVPQDHRLRIVDHHLRRHPAEVVEGALVARQHGVEPLVGKRLGVHPAGVAQGADEDMGHDLLGPDPDPPLPEVHLGLLPRRRLEAHRGLRPLRREAERPHEAEHRLYGARVAEVRRELPMQHRTVEADLRGPRREPRGVRAQDRCPDPRRPGPIPTAGPPAPHRLPVQVIRRRHGRHRLAGRQPGQHRLHHLRFHHRVVLHQSLGAEYAAFHHPVGHRPSGGQEWGLSNVGRWGISNVG
jgi:hypothetical protein